MKILQVAFPFAPVRDDTAGGAEQVLSMLDRKLSQAGHHSLVIACEGSQVEGELIPVYDPGSAPTGYLNGSLQRQVRQRVAETLTRTIREHQPDLVHLHGLDFAEYLPPEKIPVVATLHLPPSWYGAGIFSIARPDTWLHCVSKTQQASCPPGASLLPYIENGVPDLSRRPALVRRKFALGLGRVCPEKGFHLAFDASAEAGMNMLLAGQVHNYEEHQRYFETEIRPRLCRCRRFIGAAGKVRKQRLLNSAHCLLIPSVAPETSSLVAMEAAMCGTPVVAFRSGALPEVVMDGVTGFLVDDESQMAGAIGRCDEIDAARCREIAVARFSEDRATQEYFRMYERLIGR